MGSEQNADFLRFDAIDDRGAAQVAASLFAHTGGQVAGAGLAVLGLAGGGKSEPFFGSFVGLHLGHIMAYRTGETWLSKDRHYRGVPRGSLGEWARNSRGGVRGMHANPPGRLKFWGLWLKIIEPIGQFAQLVV